MAGPIPLSQVLIDEYEAQRLVPAFDRDAFEIRRKELEAELAPLREQDPEAYECKLDAELVEEVYSFFHRQKVKRSALCFSGGGIRSATFGLGLVQGLARHRLLGKFDYLSTVSGGGYLGSWLSAWIHRVGKATGDPQRAVEVVEDQLRSRPSSPLEPEPMPVAHLRTYSRYMSPKLGFLSADTWTLVSTFVRNLILNWMVLLPLLAAVLTLPKVSLFLVSLGQEPWLLERRPSVLAGLYVLAVLFGAIGIGFIAPNRPSLQGVSRFPQAWRGQGSFLAFCLLPLVLMAISITLAWSWLADGAATPTLPIVPWGPPVPAKWSFVTFGFLLHVGGYLVSRIWVRQFLWWEAFVAVPISGLVGGWLASWGASALFPKVETPFEAALYVCFATPLLLFLFFLATVLFVGLASRYTNDADREWLARASAWILIAIVVRAAAAGVALFGPVALLLLAKKSLLLTSSVGGVSGLLTLWLGARAGKQERKTERPDPTEPKMVGLLAKVGMALAAPVFVLVLFSLLSLATTLGMGKLVEATSGQPFELMAPLAEEPLELLRISFETPWWAVLAVIVGLFGFGVVMGRLIDINRFSLHGAYRERLIRAYLGASRGPDRKPHPFTGLDPEDNVGMKDLQGNRPFHVVNMALNLVAGRDLAWQDRKAESFTASPLHCGNLYLGYRESGRYGLHQRSGRAISLGTALAISGAAASPNMGYHSSAIVTFLLALFNVRLGWWLGNPGKAGEETYATIGPSSAPKALLAEALGLTNDEHPYVYLSDGGHFENLGLYEMVLRRCHLIVVSDGSQDPKFTFEDLGNAVSKIRIDLGVPITFEKIPMQPTAVSTEFAAASYDATKRQTSAHAYGAFGKICYSHVDGPEAEDGWLLYLKPSLNGTEPADVFHYAKQNPQFPHESTADQLYGEAQFESYRALGAHVMQSTLAGVQEGAELAVVFQHWKQTLT